MINWLLKLIGMDGHEEIDFVKQSILAEKKQAIQDLKRINKRFRFIIDANDIDLVIRDIHELRRGR